MNEVTKYKYWLAAGLLIALVAIFAIIILGSSLSNDSKAMVLGALTTAFALIVQYYFRKAGSNEAEPDIPESTTDDGNPKAPNPIGDMGVAQGWGTCTSCNAPTTSSNPDVVFDTVTPTDTPANYGAMNWETARNAVIKQTLDSGVNADEASVSANLVSWWANHSDEVSPVAKAGVLDWGIDLAQKAFNKVTGLKPPAKFADVASYNKYWRENSIDCKVNKATARPLLMTLRDLLRMRENL